MPIVGIVANGESATNAALVDEWSDLGIDARLLSPAEAVDELGTGDVALLRIDVSQELDSFEPGLECVPDLRLRGVRILNAPWALIGAHDKLETARRLREAGLPQLGTTHVLRADADVDIAAPAVVKPRHGSWGRDVHRCESEDAVRACLRAVEKRPWFRRQGALVQELVEPVAEDLRLIVAGGEVVGAAVRRPKAGEWRTNVSLGGRAAAVVPGERATELALAAVAAVGGDLVGVDLLPLPGGGSIVLELNGAVDFDDRYSLPETSIFSEVARALELPRRDGRRDRTTVRSRAHAEGNEV